MTHRSSDPTLGTCRLGQRGQPYDRETISRFMTWVDALGPVEGELVLVARVGGDRLEQEGVVIARVDALEHAPDEPVLAAGEDRDALGARVPVGLGELVGGVSGLAAEQLGEV